MADMSSAQELAPPAPSSCSHCGGPCALRDITISLQSARAPVTLVRNVPADVCQSCGEVHFSVATSLLLIATLQRTDPPEELAVVPIYDLRKQ